MAKATSDIVDLPFDLVGYAVLVKRFAGRKGKPDRYRVTVGREPRNDDAAEAVFVADGEDQGHFEDIYVQPGQRRRGIATALYDAFEAFGFTVTPSDTLDEDGQLFWDDRLMRRQTLEGVNPQAARLPML